MTTDAEGRAIPRNTQGSYTLPPGTLVKTGDTVLVEQHNPAMNDIAEGLTKSLARDGRGGMLASLNLNSNKLVAVGRGESPTDGVNVEQLADAIDAAQIAPAAWTELREGVAGINTFNTAETNPSHVFAENRVRVYVGGLSLNPGEFVVTAPSTVQVTLPDTLTMTLSVKIEGYEFPSGGVPDVPEVDFTYQRPGSLVIRDGNDKWGDVLSPLDYIPNSMHDAIINPVAGATPEPMSSYIQQAVDKNPGDIVWMNRGTYGAEAEIFSNGKGFTGADWANTVIVALTDGMRSVMRVAGQQSRFSGFRINAAKALHGIYANNCNSALFTSVGIDNARIANAMFPETGNNSESMFQQCVMRGGGRSYPCGTTTAAAGAMTLPITGANPSTLAMAAGAGPRLKYDRVRVAGEGSFEITSVGPDFITIVPGLTYAKSNAQVTLLQGCNLEIQRNGDNSNIKSLNTTYQNGATCAINGQALYGFQSRGDTVEFNGYGYIIGQLAGGGEAQTINWLIENPYGESFYDGALVYHGSSRQGTLRGPVVDQIGNFGLDCMRVAAINTLRSIDFEVEGSKGGKRFYYQNNPQEVQISAGVTAMFSHPNQSTPVKIELLSPSALSNASGVITYLDIKATLIFAQMGTNEIRFRCSTDTINGYPASGGNSTLTLPGSNSGRVIECRFIGGIGWTVTAGPTTNYYSG